MISEVRLITSRSKFIRSIYKLKIPSEKIILSRGCVRIGKQRSLAWSLQTESYRKVMSSSNKRINL